RLHARRTARHARADHGVRRRAGGRGSVPPRPRGAEERGHRPGPEGERNRMSDADRLYGFLGLRHLGPPMAAHIAAAGYEAAGFAAAGPKDRLPEGVHGADSVADVVRASDTVFLSVPDGRVTLAIAEQIAGLADRRATVVIDLSTVGPV